MNYNSIWKGDEYAWARDRPRGVFPRDARRCKVLGKRKIRYVGNLRDSSEVHIEFEYKKYSGETETQTQWVPAREIVDFWDNYSSELEHLKELDREREERYARERAERLAEREARYAAKMEEERREAELLELSYVTYASAIGIPREALIALTDGSITIERSAFDERMGVVRTYE